MDPVQADSTMYLIEGIGDEVTFVVAFLVFILSILGSIQLLPQSILFLRTMYQNYFASQEQQYRSENQANVTSPVQHSQSEEETKHDDDQQLTHECESPLVNNNNSTNKEQEHCEEASSTSHQSTSETEQVSSDVKSEEEPQADCEVTAAEHEEDTVGASNDTQSISNDEPEPLSRTAIVVRLKYLNDTERTVTTEPTETIANFKRVHFIQELTSQKRVRLIFNGQLLRDNMTLQAYGIMDGTVIHVQISQTQNSQTSQGNSNSGDLDLAALMWPLFSVMLAIFWVLYIKYPEYFTVPSIIILIAFSASFILVYVRVQAQPV